MVGAVKTDDLIMEEYYMELSMQYGYIRVSSKEQNEDRQYIAMSEFGIQNENIILDKQSGKNFERPGYIFASVFFMLAVFVVPAFAADGDPLAVVNNLSDFIFSLIRAVGLILLGFGILQVGLSLKSHDPSQRANGILTVAGGIVITFTKEILTLITG